MARFLIQFALNRHTAAEWAARTEIPLAGEPCWSTDTRVLKIGDGTNVWSALPAANAGVTDHAALTSLAYADSGHTGFAPTSHNHATPWQVMTTAQRSAIASPSEGMAVWDTDLHQLMVYDNTAWVGVAMTL